VEILKPLTVTAKKVKNGYLIPNSPELDALHASEIIVQIIGVKSDSAQDKKSELKKSKTR
jgi:hypothetical protein